VPVVVCVAFLLHAKAFQISLVHQAAKLQHEATPPVSYLWWSLLLGVGLVAWMFIECNWAGQIIVLVGMPVSCLAGVYASQLRALSQHHVQIDAPDLAVALLEPGVATTSRDSARDGLRDRSTTVYFDAEEGSLPRDTSGIESGGMSSGDNDEEFSGL